ncbi:hypothetical protein [Nostoc sp. GT001]|uniref:hypothetical protein n=1 Tax=Nostoc sp. GT001 TaxID=3056647 RepID=UPI0025AA66D1|nr:hypothetical protein [Nostoc sp. GT001]MDM9583687.1 hypothetical protein [Nostoc sp. GT001]
MLTVRTIKAEFDNAESYGYVYGYIVRKDIFPVYVTLGKEQEYISSPLDDKNTDFRTFVSCTVYIAETDEELDSEKYIEIIPQIKVRIFC